MTDFKGRTAVLTDAASGFGLACARIAAREGMHVVMVDVQADALAAAAEEITALATPQGGRVLARQVECGARRAPRHADDAGRRQGRPVL